MGNEAEVRSAAKRQELTLGRENGLLRAALERIAAPCRPDGTWNLSRTACYEIAKEVLEVVGD